MEIREMIYDVRCCYNYIDRVEITIVKAVFGRG